MPLRTLVCNVGRDHASCIHYSIEVPRTDSAAQKLARVISLIRSAISGQKRMSACRLATCVGFRASNQLSAPDANSASDGGIGLRDSHFGRVRSRCWKGGSGSYAAVPQIASNRLSEVSTPWIL